ncbi:copper resistance protein NlpE N-terminal domain-containing protein [Arenimonas sp. MALMAid1274]|uniref:copper resistance protein NlpE N-terminal domain-containing protein n=1 Tax=Arenimonas sp. MALMAid1274 TaxID=3411630 RepID=UPI003B9FEB31
MALPRPLMLSLACCAALALAACGGESAPGGNSPGAAGEAPPGVAASPTQGERFEISWLGVLPCADCDGIQTRLVLSSDGARQSYLLEETYLGGEGEGENRFVQEGEWREEAGEISDQPAVVYRLDPEGSSRWFWLQPDGALEMLDGENRPVGNGIDYRLQRM